MPDPKLTSLVSAFSEMASTEKSVEAASGKEDPKSKLSKLDERQKAELFYDLKMRGLPVNAIAKSYGVDASTVYRLLKKHTEEYRERLEQEPPANLIAESLQFLQNIEAMCLFESTQSVEEKEMVTDPTTGLIEKKTKGGKKASSTKMKYLQMAMRAREMQLDLMLDTGLIPKEAEKLYVKLKRDPAEEKAKVGSDRSEEEIKEHVIKLLLQGRKL